MPIALLACALAGPAAADARPRATLSTFDSCSDFLGYARENAVRKVLPTIPLYRPAPMEASGGEGGTGMPVATPQKESAAGDEAAAGGGRAGEDFSTTNNQEVGVDEPDIVKTDGQRIYTVTDGKLHALAVAGEEPRQLDTIDLNVDGYSQQLLLTGDRLLVLSYDYSGSTTFVEVDVSLPRALRVVRTLQVDGDYLSARLTGTTARIVLTATPDVIDDIPYTINEGETRKEAKIRRRKLLRKAPLREWLPQATVKKGRFGKPQRKRIVTCGDVLQPQTFSGLDVLTILTLDLSKGITAIDADSVLSDADTVYASPAALYVASERWADAAADRPGPSRNPYTQLHKFDTGDPLSTTYKASGSVPGYLLNQFSLSEKDGLLRVASTSAPEWLTDEDTDSESQVSVLEESAGRLNVIGRVGGLGKGERIYSVRFIGDMGYVVTFRETDPLYTVDVSDPRSPRVRGELKIMGYSAYLHPIGDGKLLGIGQDATEEGETLGTQLSVFDVSDPDKPVRIAQERLAKHSYSEAEYDHHAFLYWAKTGTVVLPLDDWDREVNGRWAPFSGAIGFKLDGSSISRLGTISHIQSREEYEDYYYEASIRRSLVIGDTLYTVSAAGILASTLDTMAEKGWTGFSTD